MSGLMIDSIGVGLAANQVGVLHRLLVYRVHPQSPVAALVNPEIEWVGDEQETLEEGCLSLPAVHVDVERPVHIRVTGAQRVRRAGDRRGLRTGSARDPARDRPSRRCAGARSDLPVAAQGSDARAARRACAVGPEPLRTVYLGTSEFAADVLRALAASPHRPVLVVTRPDRPRGRGRRLAAPPVADAARRLGIELRPARVGQRRGRARADRRRPARRGLRVRVRGADQGAAALRPPILNVHPSLLPRWRGAAPIERAIMAGDERTGVSIMRLTAGLDSGPVCLVQEEPITAQDTYGTLAARLAEIGGAAARAGARPYAGIPTSRTTRCATYAEKITAADRVLDADHPATEVARDRGRALTPHIGAAAILPGGERLGVWEAVARPASPAIRPRASWISPGPYPSWGARRGRAGADRGPARRSPVDAGRRLSSTACGALSRVRRPVRRSPPARTCAYAVVRRVFEQDAYADRAFHAEARGSMARERSFAMALAYGTVQRQATLDHVAGVLSDRPAGEARLTGAGGAAARSHAGAPARRGRRARRRARVGRAGQAPRPGRQRAGQCGAARGPCARGGRSSTRSTTRPRPAAAVKHSVPLWLAELWWAQLGAGARPGSCSPRSTSRPSRRCGSTLCSPPPTGLRPS